MSPRVAALYSAFQTGERWPASRRLVGVVGRYALSALGPLSIAAAHFIAALILLHEMAPAAFGLFSFALVIVPFSMSACGALMGAPLVQVVNRPDGIDAGELGTYMKANLLYALIAGAAVFGFLLMSGADWSLAAFLGAYGAAMNLRWFGRIYAYCTHKPVRAVSSDLAYSLLLLAGLTLLYEMHGFTVHAAALAMLASSLVAFASFGWGYIALQARAIRDGSLKRYLSVWKEVTRWSFLGVVSTELTVNAHAYLVTFFSGPKAFALIAVGSLFMRPVSLAMTALPDVERPIMARDVANGKIAHALRTVKEFRTASTAIWLGTLALAAVVWIWFPHLILKPEYDAHQVLIVIVLWAGTMLARSLRTPDSVLLQAAGEWRALAAPSVRSSLVSLAATAALLFAFGPVASLGGILLGDLVMSGSIFIIARKWKRDHA
ncbi:MAG TPA: hypothetical protein VHW02_11205 [Rhizomicrobium sp.]|nr:hypothetical protein [Rhizomicrobium sp.]